jgi:ribosomal protein S27E
LAGDTIMPGMSLSFKCSCGFYKNDIDVGATEEGHYAVFLCFRCKNIFSSWASRSKSYRKICRKCGEGLIAVTDKGAWGPTFIQDRFPDSEPWMVENDIFDIDEDVSVYAEEIENIRILCPKCGNLTLVFENSAFWD